MNFDPDFLLSELTPAPYNPRKLSDAGFVRLQESLAKYGVVKPIIKNGNGMIVAGHQRVRALIALGVEKAPTISLSVHVAQTDEVQFNLFHNSVETDLSAVSIEPNDNVEQYDVVDWNEIEVDEKRRGAITTVKAMTLLLMRYGPWGSVIADELGNIVANSDYAIACRLTRSPLLVYRMHSSKVEEFLTYLNGEYGVYDFTALGVKTYNAFRAQPERLAGTKKAKSVLYERDVIPHLGKAERAVDFGAGRCAYPTLLARRGIPILPYEPHMRAVGTRALDVGLVLRQMTEIRQDIEANGLFPVAILEAVLNSTTGMDWQHKVMASVNSLMAKDGRLHTSTRCLRAVEKAKNRKVMQAKVTRQLEFLDKDNYGATFRDGVWTLQHFHTEESWRPILEQYFHEVDYIRDDETYLFATVRRPRSLDPAVAREALNAEFNMEYPGGFRHNHHESLVGLILDRLSERDAS